MAKPTAFRATGGSAFRTASNRPHWRDPDRIRSNAYLFRGGGGKKKSGGGGKAGGS